MWIWIAIVVLVIWNIITSYLRMDTATDLAVFKQRYYGLEEEFNKLNPEFIGEVYANEDEEDSPTYKWHKIKEKDIKDKVDGYIKVAVPYYLRGAGYISADIWIAKKNVIFYADYLPYKNTKEKIEKRVKKAVISLWKKGDDIKC